MPLSRPMASVAAGVEEPRIKEVPELIEVSYYTRLADSILILHAFTKKTQKTPPNEHEPRDYEVHLGSNIFTRCCSQLLVPFCRDR